MKPIYILIVALGGLAVIAIGGAMWMWNQLEGVAISPMGWLALVLGIVVASAVGGGLMFLVFYSAHHGYDDEIGS
jgi:membrane-bound ClpP family serine protease